jgi:SAM-dependent methyltransferase
VLELVGETDADPAYAASVREAIVASDASILVSGPVDDAALAAAYAAADLFVLPSRYEGYGMVYAEALSFGLPVVACDVGPVPDLVGREAALLVPPDDAGALAEALDLLLGDPGLRDRMSAAARRRAGELPRWRDAVAGLREALRDAVSCEDHPAGASKDPSVKRRLCEQNRRSWNAVVGAHESHRGDLARFLRAGGTTLFPEERELLGDLTGETVAHLQCNSGGDTLSLAALGAAVVGVDLSDEAVRSARVLAEKAGIQARFERADLYDWLVDAMRRGRRFDAVYSSYGVVCWLPDLETWAAGIAGVLKPRGRFVLVDFHPVAEMLDERWNLSGSYPTGGESRILDEGVGDYVGESGGGLTPAGFAEGTRGFENPEPCHLFRWGLGEVVTALAGAGLRISVLKEYLYANGERHFSGMRELPGRRMAPPEGIPAVPLMYGLRAEKAES